MRQPVQLNLSDHWSEGECRGVCVGGKKNKRNIRLWHLHERGPLNRNGVCLRREKEPQRDSFSTELGLEITEGSASGHVLRPATSRSRSFSMCVNVYMALPLLWTGAD